MTLGTAQLGLRYGISNRTGKPTNAQVDDILGAAFDAGVLSLDTAPGYGDAEQAIGDYLRRAGRPDGLQVCSKLPRLPAGMTAAGLRAHVDDAIEGTRRRLSADRIDVYLVHEPGDIRRYGPALVDALLAGQARGLLGRIGASIYDPSELDDLPSTSGAVQYPFNAFDRRARDTGATERLHSESVLTFARSPLLQGLLTLSGADAPSRVPDSQPWLRKLTALCEAHDLNPAQAAVAYAFHESGADHVVLGVETVAQLQEAVGWSLHALDSVLVEAIDAAFGDVPKHVMDPRLWSAP